MTDKKYSHILLIGYKYTEKFLCLCARKIPMQAWPSGKFPFNIKEPLSILSISLLTVMAVYLCLAAGNGLGWLLPGVTKQG